MYQEFAAVYDRFMDDFDYPAWADYYLEILKRQGYGGGEICECGCGTGSLSIELLKRGVKLISSDISEDMLRIASDKARRSGVRARFVREDMRALKLPHSVAAVICACDGVNYLTSQGDVQSFFTAAFDALKSGGVLAFDISSRHKLENVLGNGFFGEERDDAAYLWQNSLDAQKHIVDMDITFFVQERGGLYRRFAERQTQRAHSADEIATWISECGFDKISVFGDRTFDAPHEDEMRLHFTAVKP